MFGVVQILVLSACLMSHYTRLIGFDSVHLTEFSCGRGMMWCVPCRDCAEVHDTHQAHDMHFLHHSAMTACCSRSILHVVMCSVLSYLSHVSAARMPCLDSSSGAASPLLTISSGVNLMRINARGICKNSLKVAGLEAPVLKVLTAQGSPSIQSASPHAGMGRISGSKPFNSFSAGIRDGKRAKRFGPGYTSVSQEASCAWNLKMPHYQGKPA